MDVLMSVTREHELWAIALWIEREHADDAETFIAERVLHFEATGNAEGLRLWMDIAIRFVGLRKADNRSLN